MKWLLLSLIVITTIARADQAQADKWYEEINGNGSCDGSLDGSDLRNISCKHGLFRARLFGNRFGNLQAMASEINDAIGGLVEIGAINLQKRGYEVEAEELRQQWLDRDGELNRIVGRGDPRDFKDFKPYSAWLAKVADKLQYLLGWEVFYALRLSDLDSYNYGLPVLFNPCFYGEKEWTIAFCHDPDKPHKYRGVAPITAFWATDIGCSVASFGAGWAFICGPLSMVVERFVDWKIAPAIAPGIWARACK